MKNNLLNEFGRVQFITQVTEKYSYVDTARIALEGGCRWIQLKIGNVSLDEVESVAIEVQQLCKDYGSIFIIDGYVNLAKKLMADGVFLERRDISIREARQFLGEKFIIGASANNFYHVQQHYIGGADYIACSPYRYTANKQDLSPVLGVEGCMRIVQQMESRGIHLPVIVVGGITCDDVSNVLNTGVDGIAVSNAVLQSANPVKEMNNFVKLVKP